jgi:rhodanese-related sulfurtransferase
MRKISENEFKKILKHNPDVVVIDVLSEESYEKEHIPNSINIPLEDENFISHVQAKIKSKDTPIVVYCAGFTCSASTEATSLLEENGYKHVVDFKGGLEEWHKEGNEVTSGVKA